MKRIGGAVGAVRCLAATVVLVVSVGAPRTAAAQTTTIEPTTTSSSSPTSTPISTSTSPTTSLPPTTDSVPPTTDPEADGSTITLVPGPDEPTTTIDPLVDEAPGESVPETDETVPDDPGSYGGQPGYEPQEVLWSNVDAGREKVRDAAIRRVESFERVRDARLRLKAIEFRRDRLAISTRRAVDDLQRAESELQTKAIVAFVTDETAAAAIIGSIGAADHDRILGLRARQVLLDAALGQDRIAIEDYTRLRARLKNSAVAVVDSIRRAENRIVKTTVEAEEAVSVLDQAEDELLAFEAGSAIYISGVVFPIAQPYDVPLIDSFGFPRMPGTPDEHWHEGIDLFAPSGTPLLAAERGVITKMGNNRLGGLSFWLRGESGADWYYAHLLGYSPGLGLGDVVEAGQVLGYVGNTGNAVSTPAHLHLQLHPGGGEPINPYPLLKVVSDRDLAAAG